MTCWPTAVTEVGDAFRVSRSCGVAAALTVAVLPSETTGSSDGVRPATVAVLVMLPASRSAWVVA